MNDKKRYKKRKGYAPGHQIKVVDIDGFGSQKKDKKAKNKNRKHVILLIILGIVFFFLGLLFGTATTSVYYGPPSYSYEDLLAIRVEAQQNYFKIKSEFDLYENCAEYEDTVLIRLSNNFCNAVNEYGNDQCVSFLNDSDPKYDLTFRSYLQSSMDEKFPKVINTMERLINYLETLYPNDEKIQNLSIDIIDLINMRFGIASVYRRLTPEDFISANAQYELITFINSVFAKSIELNDICKAKISLKSSKTL